MADEQERWVNAAIALWARTAPSYVQHSNRPDRLRLRWLHEAGATLEQFDEALVYAFGRSDIPKRRALAYAIGTVRIQLSEGRSRGSGQDVAR